MYIYAHRRIHPISNYCGAQLFGKLISVFHNETSCSQSRGALIKGYALPAILCCVELDQCRKDWLNLIHLHRGARTHAQSRIVLLSRAALFSAITAAVVVVLANWRLLYVGMVLIVILQLVENRLGRLSQSLLVTHQTHSRTLSLLFVITWDWLYCLATIGNRHQAQGITQSRRRPLTPPPTTRSEKRLFLSFYIL